MCKQCRTHEKSTKNFKVSVDYRECCKCREVKNYKLFTKNKSTPSGLGSRCKTCRMRYDKNSKACKLNIITPQEAFNLKNEKTVCVCCSLPMEIKCIDHCHKTNLVRDVICRKCNLALGHVNDDISILKNLIRYLQKHSTQE